MLMTGRYWVESNSRDMGTMSRQWLAEYNASHPNSLLLARPASPRPFSVQHGTQIGCT